MGGDEASFLLSFEHAFNVLHACLLSLVFYRPDSLLVAIPGLQRQTEEDES